jgi:hypothetical protein
VAYALDPSGDPDENGVYRKWYCRITLDAYPDQAVETEFEQMNEADATDAAETLDATVTANPQNYFGSI